MYSTSKKRGVPMRITQLKQLLVIYRHGSISKAAQELYVSQPSLSAMLNELEKELGITIFERTSKGVIPTQEGQIIIQEAWNAIESIERITHIAETNLQQEIKLTSGALFHILLPDVAVQFRTIWPNIMLNFMPPKKIGNIFDDMIKGHYRITLSCYPKDMLKNKLPSSRFQAITLFETVTPHAFLYENHPFAQNSIITYNDLAKTHLIMSNTSHTEFFLELYPELKHHCDIYTTDISSALQMAKYTQGITVMNSTPALFKHLQKSDPTLRIIPIETGQHTPADALLITVKEEFLTRAEQDLVKIICNVAEQKKKDH